MKTEKGQVFVVSAVIFSALILLTAFSYQQISFNDQGQENRFFFDNTLEKQSEVFNSELSENYSAENLRKGFYRYNSFVNTSVSSRGMSYEGFQVLVLPEQNRTVLINYRSMETNFSYYSDGWRNGTVEDYQSRILDGKENPRKLEIEELGVSERFNASTPRMVGFMEMESETSVWRNYILR
ncbi:MAG: hypothetical protein ACI8Z7_000850 [Candidatus Nanohaloarchaea archaeon]|jgi:hypothetical protein